jgi:type I restriction enzyme M protein
VVHRSKQGVDRRAQPPPRDPLHRCPADQIDLTAEEIARIASVYHSWRGQHETGPFADEPGFSKAATLEDIAKAGFALTPGRYVGAATEELDEAAFQEQMAELVGQLREDFAESERLTAEVRRALGSVGHEL